MYLITEFAYIYQKRKGEYIMGRLIIDGNSVFELDEKCLKERKIPEECEIKKYLNETKQKNQDINKRINNEEK